MGPHAAEKQAEQLRKDAKVYFSKEKFAAAIEAYTEVYVYSTFVLNYAVIWE